MKRQGPEKNAGPGYASDQRAENGGLDPSWLMGRPDFQSKGTYFKGFWAPGRKIGAPQKREKQP